MYILFRLQDNPQAKNNWLNGSNPTILGVTLSNVQAVSGVLWGVDVWIESAFLWVKWWQQRMFCLPSYYKLVEKVY